MACQNDFIVMRDGPESARMRSHLAHVGLIVVIALTACSTGEPSGTTLPSVTTTSQQPDTTPPTTDSTTTTTSVSTTTTPPPSHEAEGSGCAPGTDLLPDGDWYGVIADYSEQSVVFDLACFFTGEAAIKAAAEDGEESPPPNDYYVRNESDVLRDLIVDPATPVIWYLNGDPASETKGRFEDWVDVLASRGFFFGIWVTIEGGDVVAIEEKWVP